MLGVLRAICTVVGAVVFYCAIVGALWYALVRVGRRRSRRQAGRRAAARGVPLGPGGAPAEPERAAGSWDDLPAWLSAERPWAVAVVLLGAPALRDRTAPFVDFAHHSVDWTALLEESRAWPTDQRLLVRSAYDLSVQVRTGRLEPRMG